MRPCVDDQILPFGGGELASLQLTEIFPGGIPFKYHRVGFGCRPCQDGPPRHVECVHHDLGLVLLPSSPGVS